MKKTKNLFYAYSGKEKAKMWAMALFMAICLGVFATAVFNIATTQMQYGSAQQEYAALQSRYKPQNVGQSVPGQSTLQAPPTKSLGEINPDYAGWIEIPGTKLDYPFVQAKDNEKYLSTTFEGQKNLSGAVFMDAACQANLSSYHTILYAHNIKNGSMFGILPNYLDDAYLAKHPNITLTDKAGNRQNYRIFAARKVGMYDDAYRLSFADANDFSAFALGLGAPFGQGKMLTLSTCTNVAQQERILVHAMLG